MKRITLVGIDLAKEVFELNGVDELGKTVLRKTLKRAELAPFLANFPSCRIVMEACGGAHHWARKFTAQGHHAQLIAAQFVKPFKTTKQKNDRVDAQAIVEAASRPSMRYVGTKNLFQQDLQSLHRIRQQLINNRTQISNQIRGLFAEYGVVMDEGLTKFKSQFPTALEEDSELTPIMREAGRSLYELFSKFEEEQSKVEEQIKSLVKDNEDYKRLVEVPGVGPWSASLFLGTAGNVGAFKNGRQLSAWAGLVPRQFSSGGQERLGKITKAGDAPLRVMLIHGARSVILAAIRKQKTDPYSQWILQLHKTKGFNKTAVAVANKNVRVMWHLLKYQEAYRVA